MNIENYFKERLEDQINWYDKKSNKNQRWFKFLRILEIILSALIPLIILFTDVNDFIVKVIISSIGAGKWRRAMPVRGTDGFERADLLDKYLIPIQTWIDSGGEASGTVEDKLSEKIKHLLGNFSDKKRFLTSLLFSLLRCQQQAARTCAEYRNKKEI